MSRYNTQSQRWIKRFLPKVFKHKYQLRIDEANISRWEKQGKVNPPPHVVKVQTIRKFQQETNYNVLVETGTFMGDMIYSQIENFNEIHSIELSKEYWERATKLFANEPKVKLHLGDSGRVMKDLISKIEEPAIFWLDGHYSGGNTAKGEKLSPIYEELEAIFSVNLKHCLLIDDARLFNGSDDYPTLEELQKFILEHRPHAKINVAADTISVIY